MIRGNSGGRHIFGESNGLNGLKGGRSLKDGLKPILCVGETIEERQAEQTTQVIAAQLASGLEKVTAEEMSDLIIAYEPVWVIGTGLTATPEQAVEVHKFIREQLRLRYGDSVADATRILYGGSVKPENTEGLLSNADIDGALVGGASLKVDSFLGIIEAAGRLV